MGSESLVTPNEVGRAYFVRYCAVCHGIDGRGSGDYANVLSVAPPDLTTLVSRRDAADFPADELAAVIDGRNQVRAHGEPEMPVWGERFISAAPVGSRGEVVVRAEVRLLVEYIRSIQEEASQAEGNRRWIAISSSPIELPH